MSTDDKPDCTDDRYVTPGDLVSPGDTEKPEETRWLRVSTGDLAWLFEVLKTLLHNATEAATDAEAFIRSAKLMALVADAHSFDIPGAEATRVAWHETVRELEQLDRPVVETLATQLTQAAGTIGQTNPKQGGAILLLARLVYLIAEKQRG